MYDFKLLRLDILIQVTFFSATSRLLFSFENNKRLEAEKKRNWNILRSIFVQQNIVKPVQRLVLGWLFVLIWRLGLLGEKLAVNYLLHFTLFVNFFAEQRVKHNFITIIFFARALRNMSDKIWE